MKTNTTETKSVKNWHECKSCGRHNDNKAKWCWHCGTNQKSVKEMNPPGMFEAMQLLSR